VNFGRREDFSSAFFLSSSIRSSSQPCRNALENTQGKVDKAARLHQQRQSVLHCKQSLG
jgi:hypothetical protein